MNIKEILLQILTIINYAGDKEAFVEKFINLIYGDALLDLIETVPAYRQKEIKEEITPHADNPEKIAKTFKKHFTQKQIEAAVQNATKKLVEDYIKTIHPTLSEPQQEKLLALAGELMQQQQSLGQHTRHRG